MSLPVPAAGCRLRVLPGRPLEDPAQREEALVQWQVALERQPPQALECRVEIAVPVDVGHTPAL